MDNQFILGIASFVGAILGVLLTNFFNAHLANQQRKETRRHERLQFLTDLLQKLIDSYSTFQSLYNSGFNPTEQERWASNVSKGMVILLSIDDKILTEIALEKMKDLPLVNKDNYEKIRQGYIEGISRLAIVIKELE